jgi:hypothetical protein
VSIVLALSFEMLTSLTCLDESLYIVRQGLPMEMLLNGLDGSSLARMTLQNHPWSNQVNMNFIPWFNIVLNFGW